jgi:hypothetical protein
MLSLFFVLNEELRCEYSKLVSSSLTYIEDPDIRMLSPSPMPKVGLVYHARLFRVPEERAS